MSHDELEKLVSAFVHALGVSPATDFNALKYRSIPEWDSIGHMQLIAAIENSFGVMIDTDDVLALDSFPKAREILGKYGV